MNSSLNCEDTRALLSFLHSARGISMRSPLPLAGFLTLGRTPQMGKLALLRYWLRHRSWASPLTHHAPNIDQQWLSCNMTCGSFTKKTINEMNPGTVDADTSAELSVPLQSALDNKWHSNVRHLQLKLLCCSDKDCWSDYSPCQAQLLHSQRSTVPR